ncbi:MAG: hypothetical protein JXR83_02860, partial [Deltaproteobacteria bacterium]|nr:hypothetical protein [Deltaproteobacteria bacterium]
GESLVVVVLDGYERAERRFELARGMTATWGVTLQPTAAWVTIKVSESCPAGAAVRLQTARTGASQAGTVPCRLKIPADMPVSIRVERTGYRPAEKMVQMPPGTEATWRPRLVTALVDDRAQALQVAVDRYRRAYARAARAVVYDRRDIGGVPLAALVERAGMGRFPVIAEVRELDARSARVAFEGHEPDATLVVRVARRGDRWVAESPERIAHAAAAPTPAIRRGPPPEALVGEWESLRYEAPDGGSFVLLWALEPDGTCRLSVTNGGWEAYAGICAARGHGRRFVAEIDWTDTVDESGVATPMAEPLRGDSATMVLSADSGELELSLRQPGAASGRSFILARLPDQDAVSAQDAERSLRAHLRLRFESFGTRITAPLVERLEDVWVGVVTASDEAEREFRTYVFVRDPELGTWTQCEFARRGGRDVPDLEPFAEHWGLSIEALQELVRSSGQGFVERYDVEVRLGPNVPLTRNAALPGRSEG